jgi:hypothetical protein
LSSASFCFGAGVLFAVGAAVKSVAILLQNHNHPLSWCSKCLSRACIFIATRRVLLGMVLHVLAHHVQERNKTDETISGAVLFCVLIFSLLL